MFTLRPAGTSDPGAIYRFLNTPVREKLLAEPLPEEGKFLLQSARNHESGRERYYILEQDGSMEGIIRIITPEQSCEIWGRALRTLFYHCGRIAFEELGMPRLRWYVRWNNRRMIRTCELFHIRRTGEAPFCNITENFSFVAIGSISYYELTPEEFRERVELMRRCALNVHNVF